MTNSNKEEQVKAVKGYALVDDQGISTVRITESSIKDVQLMHGGEVIEVLITPVSFTADASEVEKLRKENADLIAHQKVIQYKDEEIENLRKDNDYANEVAIERLGACESLGEKVNDLESTIATMREAIEYYLAQERDPTGPVFDRIQNNFIEALSPSPVKQDEPSAEECLEWFDKHGLELDKNEYGGFFIDYGQRESVHGETCLEAIRNAMTNARGAVNAPKDVDGHNSK